MSTYLPTDPHRTAPRNGVRPNNPPAPATQTGPAPLRLVPPPEDSGIRTPGHCELGLLGGFHLVVEDVVVDTGPTVQRLLAVLVCLNRQAPRHKIARMLWPDASHDRAHSNLRTTLYRLQRQAPGLVLSTKTDVRLAPELRVDIDSTRAFASSLLSIRPDDHAEVMPLVQWTELDRDLLPDWDDGWLIEYQACYRRLRLDALERLADLLTVKRQYGAAVQAALAVIHADTLRETAHEQLIRAYLAQGNRHDAISHYAGYCKTLRDELGLDPATTLNELLWSQAS
ncbi:MAG TPA: BTAD domain-containing putative transcriptional regulator [Jatrophihabitans sp.]|jgi:DNA-binding SARP family transcriptional activator|uniref:AfsR/SARP family transcriptional regulator n=1 Tax=Jatrophihabitans sp. TaxID=1932789 RepID=UPI002EE2FB59